MQVFRKLIRTLALLVGLALVSYGMISGALPQKPTDPPNDSVWLVCLAGAFPLFLIYAWLAASDLVGKRSSLDARFRRNVQQVGGFLLVGFGLLSLHLLREQIV